jgi:hypothetical protein
MHQKQHGGRPYGFRAGLADRQRAQQLIGLFCACALWAGSAQAFPLYLEAFELRYPSSTLTARMQTQTGSKCSTCHIPQGTFFNGNCYRLALKTNLQQGKTIEQALLAVEPLDSDGDGVPNIIEILRPRVGPGNQVGYSPGLIGPEGKDQCVGGPIGELPISKQNESPCLADADLNGTLDIDDFIAFQTLFALADESADLNFDSVLNINDFIEFQTLFALGCSAF